MNTFHHLVRLFTKLQAPALLLLLISCNIARQDQQGVEAAMKYYDRLILQQDAGAISRLFTPDGNLGDMAIGRDSIRNFLSSFKNVRVLSQYSRTSTISITGDSAIQKGTYSQADIISGRDTVHVKGEFRAQWQWVAHKGWLIRKMNTKSM